MDDIESMHIGETPHVSINSSGGSRHDSVDSGYLTLTPRYTSMVNSCKIKSSSVSIKRHRFRPDPWQREKLQRHRSKLNQLLNASEPDYLISASGERSLLEASRGNVGLVHSTPSCADDGFDDEEEVLRNGKRRNWRATVPITPASTDLELLSPPPSPAVPTPSYVASEPVHEDVEMKLVVMSPEITPRYATSPRLQVPSIAVSPVRGGPAVTSVENQRLNKLSIADLGVVPEIKPKRLDFSCRGYWFAGPPHSKASLGYAGREKMDFLSYLGEKSNHLELVSKILSYLGPQDLCSVSLVSTVWRGLCENDAWANRKRMDYVVRRQNIKENLKVTKKLKHEQNIQTSPKSRYARKGCLLDVQNLLSVPLQARPPNSPPVSPSKVKFHSYVKVGRTLARGEYLLPCPRCTFPCHVDSENNVGTCSRQGCSIEFCTSCSSKRHTGPCKTPLLATPTKRNKRVIVGSRQSKRNLRRL